MQLKTKFQNLINSLYVKEIDMEKEWGYLEENYSKDYKAYHNLTHLIELFKQFEVYESLLKHPEEVAFSIFYHDIIYNIGDNQNEEKSGREAVRVLQEMGVEPTVTERINQLILATKSHESKTQDEKWMIDFDLSILGQSWEVYEGYSKKIRQEYKKIPSLLYRNGRKKVLKHFLEKKSIYKTEQFISLYELNARNNLKQELQNL
jgi:predicted metal-dependent HD superfamily phosphohydrolase